LKLILANNQSERFRSFYEDLKSKSSVEFDYSPYSSLIFIFNNQSDTPIDVINLETNRHLKDYDGVFINGYLNTYELAASVAIACGSNNIGFNNHELHSPISLAKLTMYAKLAAAHVSMPSTVGGTKKAITKYLSEVSIGYPLILKRADADRGIDNYMVDSAEEVLEQMKNSDDRSIWILQEFIENEGYYRVSFYNDPAFGIYRDRRDRSDNNRLKAHIYNQKGGENASLVAPENIPRTVLDVSTAAVKAVDRQLGGVDCIYLPNEDRAYVLEVQYNPQLVTIDSFKEERVKAFVDFLENIGKD
jgi:hypothetical protein